MNEKLKSEIKTLKLQHAKTLKSLKEELQTKVDEQKETDVRMTQINVYIDQLEERLASFAIARREITEREEQCALLEEQMSVLEQNCTSLQQQIEKQNEEQDELKIVMELMIQERTSLKQSSDEVMKQKDQLQNETTTLQNLLAQKKEEYRHLEQVVLKDMKNDLMEKGQQIHTLIVTHNAGMLEKDAQMNNLTALLSECRNELQLKASIVQDMEEQRQLLIQHIQEYQNTTETLQKDLEDAQYQIMNMTVILEARRAEEEEYDIDFDMEKEEEKDKKIESDSETTAIIIMDSDDQESSPSSSTIVDDTISCNTGNGEEIPGPPPLEKDDVTDEAPLSSLHEESIPPPPPPLDDNIGASSSAKQSEILDSPPPPPLDDNIGTSTSAKQSEILDSPPPPPLDDNMSVSSVTGPEILDSPPPNLYVPNDNGEENKQINEQGETFSNEASEGLWSDSDDEIIMIIDDDDEEDNDNSSDEEDQTDLDEEKKVEVKKDDEPLQEDKKQEDPELPDLNRMVEAKRPQLPPGFRPPPRPKRSVPLRGLRKTISRYTGIHGFFTPASPRNQPMRRPLPPGMSPPPPLPANTQQEKTA